MNTLIKPPAEEMNSPQYFVARETDWDDWYRVRSYAKYHPGPNIDIYWEGDDYKEALRQAKEANVISGPARLRTL